MLPSFLFGEAPTLTNMIAKAVHLMYKMSKHQEVPSKVHSSIISTLRPSLGGTPATTTVRIPAIVFPKSPNLHKTHTMLCGPSFPLVSLKREHFYHSILIAMVASLRASHLASHCGEPILALVKTGADSDDPTQRPNRLPGK
jgi:hypothetical protein